MVQHTIVQENLLESFQPFLHYYEASRLDCGVILARAELSEARLAGCKRIWRNRSRRRPRNSVTIPRERWAFC